MVKLLLRLFSLGDKNKEKKVGSKASGTPTETNKYIMSILEERTEGTGQKKN